MDPRRKKIYVILIVVCFGLSAGILLWTFVFNNPTTDPGSNQFTVPIPTAPRAASGNVVEGFVAPSVFPSTSEFKSDVLGSNAYTQLKEYTPVDLVDDEGKSELGRTDPFMTY
jgi:hypothetical protein